MEHATARHLVLADVRRLNRLRSLVCNRVRRRGDRLKRRLVVVVDPGNLVVVAPQETNECHELTKQQREEEKHIRYFCPRRLLTSTRACP